MQLQIRICWDLLEVLELNSIGIAYFGELSSSLLILCFRYGYGIVPRACELVLQHLRTDI